MPLSAEIYLQLVEGLRSEPRAGRELRSAARVGVSGELKIQLIEGECVQAPIKVRLRDLSVDGMGITSSHRLEIGWRYLVAFPRKNREDLVLICQVRHCDLLADQIYNIGSIFIGDNACDERFGVGKNAKHIRKAILS